MAKSTKRWVALLRGVGPSTHKKMSMEDLRVSCSALGLEAVSTYIASGNLLFESDKPKNELLKILAGVLHSFGLNNPVILRNPAELRKVVIANAHPEAALNRPNHCLVVFYNDKVDLASCNALRQWPGPERISSVACELVIDYKEGVGSSKLTPAVLDRHIGLPGTARNWNTVNKLLTLMKG